MMLTLLVAWCVAADAGEKPPFVGPQELAERSQLPQTIKDLIGREVMADVCITSRVPSKTKRGFTITAEARFAKADSPWREGVRVGRHPHHWCKLRFVFEVAEAQGYRLSPSSHKRPLTGTIVKLANSVESDPTALSIGTTTENINNVRVCTVHLEDAQLR